LAILVRAFGSLSALLLGGDLVLGDLLATRGLVHGTPKLVVLLFFHFSKLQATKQELTKGLLAEIALFFAHFSVDSVQHDVKVWKGKLGSMLGFITNKFIACKSMHNL